MNGQTNRKELRHDRHTVSLLTDHMVFAPKYRGKILTGDVAMITEGILCKTCKELGIEIIEIAVNPDHVHIFFKYPPKYSLSFIAKRLKGRTSRILRKEFPHLREWCGEHMWAPSCFHGSVGNGWDVVSKYIETQDHTMLKTLATGIVLKSGVCDCNMRLFSCSYQAIGDSNNYIYSLKIGAYLE